ncbi:YxD-tail cyclophane-containing RiPP peptide [Streptomyces sp. NPDC088350]|uniref:YxD-tail cyclophane-containing RiPP peptide n=1 Tax=Streptomyces sp. NPDC088350 TaxID=3365854 RepID=UPI00380EE335
MRRRDGDGPPWPGERGPGGALPDFADLDLKALSRQSSHPVLAAVAGGLLPRMLRGEPAMAFYEDGPYQL